ncbi:MAG: hypothetical protein Kapaf2KO_00280 [Candidatus Kapaibacteriales bacterium]
MDAETNNKKPLNGTKFRYRIDFYWKSLAIFTVTILFWSFINGAMEGKGFHVSFSDPISIVIWGIIGITVVSMIIAMYKANRIIIAENAILFKNRIRRKEVSKTEIEKIEPGRERTFREDEYNIIRVYIKGRKRPLRIRPSMFYEEQKLSEMLLTYLNGKGDSIDL